MLAFLLPAALAQALPAQPPPPPAPAAQEQPAPPPASDVVVRGRSRRGDPLSPLNARSFDAARAVDRALVGPAARAYGRRSPAPLRDGLRNFLSNLREPVVFANYLLQLKPGRAAETAGRFALNSTLGAAGLFDVARRRPFRLPRRRNSFANTLGFYGVGPGPFFFLPLVGATSLRDLAGNVADQFIIPFRPLPLLGEPEVSVPLGLLSALDYRAQYDGALACLAAAPDPYAATRAYYLARRRAEIDALRGRPPGPAGVPAGPLAAPTARGVAASVGCPDAPPPR